MSIHDRERYTKEEQKKVEEGTRKLVDGFCYGIIACNNGIAIIGSEAEVTYMFTRLCAHLKEGLGEERLKKAFAIGMSSGIFDDEL